MADYIETFYNPDRRHSSLDYLTPNEYEASTLKLTTRPNCHKAGPPNGVKAIVERKTGFEPATLTLAR